MLKNKTPSLARRDVVAGLCVAGMVPLLSIGSSGQRQQTQSRQATARSSQALATGEMDSWTRVVGTEFEAAGFRLRLAGVEPLPSNGMRPARVARRRGFLAVFDVLGGGEMPGDLIYAVRSPQHALDMFISSAATPGRPGRMHAVFN
jgi:hypothetical protein